MLYCNTLCLLLLPTTMSHETAIPTPGPPPTVIPTAILLPQPTHATPTHQQLSNCSAPGFLSPSSADSQINTLSAPLLSAPLLGGGHPCRCNEGHQFTNNYNNTSDTDDGVTPYYTTHYLALGEANEQQQQQQTDLAVANPAMSQTASPQAASPVKSTAQQTVDTLRGEPIDGPCPGPLSVLCRAHHHLRCE